MSNSFHIIIKISKCKVIHTTYPALITIYENKKKDMVQLTMEIKTDESLVFHTIHNSKLLNDIDSVKFDFLSKNSIDSILLECIEIVNLKTKKHKYFRCNKWIGGSENLDFSISKEFARSNKRNCIEIFKGKDKQFYFRVRAGNSEIVAQSEGYRTKANAIKGITALNNVFAHSTIYDLCSNKIIPLISNQL